MTKKSKKKTETRIDWRTILTDPLLQYILALLVVAVGAITLLALFRLTPALFGVRMGGWVEAWIGWLRHWFGWGAYPIAVVILLAGLLWLAHHLDRPIKWRWRPFVGVELVFFSLLALTHTIVCWGNPGRLWTLIEDGWGGGVVGWAMSVMSAEYLGWPMTTFILLALLVFGLGLGFDVTAADVRRATVAVREALNAWAARRRSARSADAAQVRPAGVARSGRSRQSQAAPPVQRERPRPLPPARVEPAPRREPAPLPPIPEHPFAAPPLAEPEPQVTAAFAVPQFPREYSLPPLDLLNDPQGPVLSDEEIREKSAIIEETLGQFGLPVEVAEVRVGPTVTQFGISPGFVERSNRRKKVRVSQISALADDLALALAAARIRVEAPVPGRSIVGIEVPNSEIQLVGVREVIEADEFQTLDAPLAFTVGRDVAGEPVVADLSRMPHLLIAGTTGSGKSICIKALTTCLIYNNTPDDLRLVMIDPKMVELVRFNGLPHLYGRVEVDLERVVKVLRWVAWEMDSRYKRFAAATARNIDDYNRLMKQQEEPTIPRIVVLVDELADLMMLAPEDVERTICRIAQMARATGIHLVVATQRPSVDVVTGLIKANFPARISFATVSQIDSRVILDMPGAETLMGNGDMLYLAADAGYPVRVQGCFVSEGEVDHLVDFWRAQVGPIEEEAPWERMMRPGERDPGGEGAEEDDMLQKAIALVRSTGSASASLLQRRLRIGHPRAARLMQQMEEMGVVGPPEAAGRTRRVIIGDGG